jgi:hypothetical protein
VWRGATPSERRNGSSNAPSSAKSDAARSGSQTEARYSNNRGFGVFHVHVLPFVRERWLALRHMQLVAAPYDALKMVVSKALGGESAWAHDATNLPRGRFNAPSAQLLDKGRNIAQAMARRATHLVGTLRRCWQPRNSRLPEAWWVMPKPSTNKARMSDVL